MSYNLLKIGMVINAKKAPNIPTKIAIYDENKKQPALIETESKRKLFKLK